MIELHFPELPTQLSFNSTGQGNIVLPLFLSWTVVNRSPSLWEQQEHPVHGPFINTSNLAILRSPFFLVHPPTQKLLAQVLKPHATALCLCGKRVDYSLLSDLQLCLFIYRGGRLSPSTVICQRNQNKMLSFGTHKAEEVLFLISPPLLQRPHFLHLRSRCSLNLQTGLFCF